MGQLQLTDNQKSVFEKIKAFLADDSKDIFIFKGYAGTGKTTLITYLGNYLHENHWAFEVLAPTGRAAKVLRSKFAKAVVDYGYSPEIAGMGETIHSAIYSQQISCIETESEAVEKKSYKFFFPLKRVVMNSKSVLIIDESSMIGDTMVDQEFLKFGSGQLLSDILEYKRLSGVGKIIFVGDDAQLPPVCDSESWALKAEYFAERGLGVSEGELTEVIRQGSDSLILQNANAIREVLKMPVNQRNTYSFEFGEDVVRVEGTDVARQYVDRNGFPDIGKCVFVVYSNRQCFTYNQAVRDILFGDGEKLTYEGNSILKLRKDDLLLNTKNTHEIWGKSIYNGDMLKVLEVGQTVSRFVPVKIKGDKSPRSVRLCFTEAVLLDDNGDTFRAMLLDNSLYAAERDISVYEMRALYVDFCLRMRESYKEIKEGSEEFRGMLLKDMYFNALHVKFGYAITCHKAQGGEWENVWVDYSGRVGLSNAALRWCYTATTRTRKTLMAVSAPNITPYTKLNFNTIQKVGRPPQGFLSESLRVDEPGTEVAPPGVSLKVRGIKEALEETPYKLQSFIVMGYQLRMTFLCDERSVTIDAYYNGDGILKRLWETGNGTPEDDLRHIVNEAMYVPDPLPYQPSNEVFAGLYSKMQCACAEADAKILNVTEDIGSYNVVYSLRTDALFATIKYYFGINFGLTTAMPSSELGPADAKLVKIMENIK